MTGVIQKLPLAWIKRAMHRQKMDKQDLDLFFLVDDLVIEEDGYLPSELNIDDFLLQNSEFNQNSTIQRRPPVHLSWMTCMIFGTLLGAVTFVVYALAFTTIITNTTIGSMSTYFHQAGQTHPSNRRVNPHRNIAIQSLWNKDSPPWSPCGNTSSSAHAAGCKFGPMAFAWYPSECYDLQTEMEFLASEQWKWFSEPEVSYPINYEERVRQVDGEDEEETPLSSSSDEYQHPQTELQRYAVLAGIHDAVYTDAAYWDRFCEFAERKLWRAVAGAVGGDEEKILLDNYSINAGQREMCIANRPEDPMMLEMKFLNCIRW